MRASIKNCDHSVNDSKFLIDSFCKRLELRALHTILSEKYTTTKEIIPKLSVAHVRIGHKVLENVSSNCVIVASKSSPNNDGISSNPTVTKYDINPLWILSGLYHQTRKRAFAVF